MVAGGKADPVGIRHIVVILGDQLDSRSSALDGFDRAQDRIWMCEAVEESTHIPSSKQRIAVFIAAMRHFAVALGEQGLPVDYRALGAGCDAESLGQALAQSLSDDRPRAVVLCEPGDWRVLQQLRAVCERPACRCTCARIAISSARVSSSNATLAVASSCDLNISIVTCGVCTGS